MSAVLAFPQKMSARIEALETAARVCEWHAKEADLEAKHYTKAKLHTLAAIHRNIAIHMREAARDIREHKAYPL
jgi:hypothetical protein